MSTLTTNYSLYKPAPFQMGVANELNTNLDKIDVELDRVARFVNTWVGSLETALAGKAPLVHLHHIADTMGLQNELLQMLARISNIEQILNPNHTVAVTVIIATVVNQISTQVAVTLQNLPIDRTEYRFRRPGNTTIIHARNIPGAAGIHTPATTLGMQGGGIIQVQAQIWLLTGETYTSDWIEYDTQLTITQPPIMHAPPPAEIVAELIKDETAMNMLASMINGKNIEFPKDPEIGQRFIKDNKIYKFTGEN